MAFSGLFLVTSMLVHFLSHSLCPLTRPVIFAASFLSCLTHVQGSCFSSAPDVHEQDN